MFVNEAGYYYESSGTGVSVAIKTEYVSALGTRLVLQQQVWKWLAHRTLLISSRRQSSLSARMSPGLQERKHGKCTRLLEGNSHLKSRLYSKCESRVRCGRSVYWKMPWAILCYIQLWTPKIFRNSLHLHDYCIFQPCWRESKKANNKTLRNALGRCDQIVITLMLRRR